MTIEELGEEYVKSTLIGSESIKKSAFRAGTNAILEQIEKLTNNQNWCAFPKQSHKELKELIEHLKK